MLHCGNHSSIKHSFFVAVVNVYLLLLIMLYHEQWMFMIQHDSAVDTELLLRPLVIYSHLKSQEFST